MDENILNELNEYNIIKECPDETIILNVGGIKYETYRSTLTAYPETFLGTMFQKRNQELLNPRNGNEYFFDRSGQIFHYVMQFYRTGKICYGDQIPLSLKEIETELDFFQIPRSTASAIDKVVITKATNLINAFKQLIKEVAEIYMKESSFKNFKAEMLILFLDNGQATVNVDKKGILGISDIFENTKNYAYNIMALYRDEIKSHLENEYPELTWVHQHNGEDLQYWKIKITIDWNLNYEKILANVLNI
ncbi:hypothetical protein Glove_586g35 [Diversispora epigaea]|uniref:BTB domain-containing protein n=1 Tax=Diversispora epigaea TaxID=1348612 RepID=A0A397GBH8_9GLOM|nr:hypothetical protein Glove_586g35 [Diversispora epigaea]